MFRKIKIFMISFCVMVGLVGYASLNGVSATTEREIIEGTAVLDLNEIEVGDSVTVYVNEKTGGKLIIDFLPTKSSRLTTGTGSWSGGTIPDRTVTMYPHYEDSNYDYSEIGYYVTYDGKNKKLLDTYGETVGVLDGEIDNLSSRITTAKATNTAYARSQMTWTYEKGASMSCYLIQEINYKNQTRLKWRF